jgi:predicted ATP-dependent endonuclease of OLD family
MIRNIIIENFRSIGHVEIELGTLNAFIGPNNSGKSNIMKALNLVLGETYPSVRSFDEKDFHNYDRSNSIKIEVRFDSPLGCNPDVYGFRLSFDGINCEYLAVDARGNILTYIPSGREVRVSTQMKDEVLLMHLGLDRQASQQLRATQWTLYGKLLRHIERRIAEEKKIDFKESIENSYESYISPELRKLENILKTHIKQQTGLELNLRLSILDPIETIKNLRPYLKEVSSSMEFDAEDMGAGTQSALAVAIARAYAEIVRQPLVMAIEEPELYLHPHGCRHFYNLLKELSESGVQIIYATHERSFVDISNFQSLHLVRKESGETKVCSGIGKRVSSEDEIKMASKFNEDINEVFFANHVILVEGFPDKIACQLALEKLGMGLDQKSISIIECGSNTAIKPIGEVLKYFAIPTYALIDEDPGNRSTERIIVELKSFLGTEDVFLQRPNLETLFGLDKKPSKMEAVAFFPSWFSSNNPCEVYKQVKKRIEEGF